MRTATRYIQLKAAAVLGLVALLPDTSAWSWNSAELANYLTGYGGDDHQKLTAAALPGPADTTYLDLSMYATQIQAGARTEGFAAPGSHTSVDGTVTYWFGNDVLWKDDALKKYKAFDFNSAYTELGFAVHLAEDADVPAHQQVDWHGLGYPVSYNLSFANPVPLPNRFGFHNDGLEYYASYNDANLIQPDISWNQPFLDPQTGCNEKFWLTDAEDGDPGSGWGAYGRNTANSCPASNPNGGTPPATSAGIDWFNDANYQSVLAPLSQRIAQAQLWQARVDAQNVMEIASRQFPPLLRNLQTSSQFLGPDSPARFTFHAMDNRSSAITFTASILNIDGTDTGKKAFDGQNLPALQSGTALPFEGDESILWNGTPTDGSTLASGQYRLCAIISDEDGNPSPGPGDGHIDTCILFTKSDLALKDSDSNGNLTVCPGSTTSCPPNDNPADIVLSVSATGGLSNFSLTSPDASELLFQPIVIDETGKTSDSFVFDDVSLPSLPIGHYLEAASDVTGNSKQISFAVDGPPLAVINLDGPQYTTEVDVEGNATETIESPYPNISFAAQDPVSGIQNIVITAPDGSVVYQSTFTDNPLKPEPVSLTLNPGPYTFTVTNGVGDQTNGTILDYTLNFAVLTSTQGSSATPSDNLGNFNYSLKLLPMISAGNATPPPTITAMSLVDQNGQTIAALTPPFTTPTLHNGPYVIAATDDQNDTIQNGLLLSASFGVFSFPFNGPGVALDGAELRDGEYGLLQNGNGTFDGPGTVTSPPYDLVNSPTGIVPNGTYDSNGNLITSVPPILSGAGGVVGLGIAQILPPGDSRVSSMIPNGSPQPSQAGMTVDIEARGALSGSTSFEWGTAVVNGQNFSTFVPRTTTGFNSPVDATQPLSWKATLSASSDGLYTPVISSSVVDAYMAVASVYTSPQGAFVKSSSSDGSCQFSAPAGNLPVTRQNITKPLPQGYQQIGGGGGGCLVDPVLQFPVPAVLTLQFSPQAVVDQNLDPNTVTLFFAPPNGSFSPVPGAMIDPINGAASASLPLFQTDTVFAVFAKPKQQSNPDITPPVTTLAFSSATTDGSGTFVISTSAQISILAVDPVVANAVTSGVATTYYLIDRAFVSLSSTPASVYQSTFSLAVGTHSITYFSVDHAGNFEAARVSSASVVIPDTTPPATQLSLSGPFETDSSGNVYATTSTFVTLNAADPILAGSLTSGLATTYYLLDRAFVSLSSTPPNSYAAPFNLSLGTHVVTYFSVDNAGNFEVPRSSAVIVDATLPNFNSSDGNPPGNLSVNSISSATATLTWDANGNSPGTAYNVYFATFPSSAQCSDLQSLFSQSFFISANSNSISLNGLTPSANYAFGVCTQGSGCDQPVLAQTLAPGSNSQNNPPTTCGPGGNNGGGGNNAGLAVGFDSSNRLWSVAQANGQFYLSRFTNPAGAPDFSLAIPAAQQDGNWTLSFDTFGFVYAIGTTSGPLTVGEDLAVFKLSLSGSFISSAAFHGGVDGRALGLDSTGDVWIAGAILTGDPGNGGSSKLGLWKYCIHDGSLRLKAAYSRGFGADAGYGLRVNEKGIWIAGYSASTAQGFGGPFDLALWHFSVDGSTLVAPPLFRPNYLPQFFQNAAVKLAASPSALYIAATRLDSNGMQGDLAFLKFDPAGNLLLEEAFAPSNATAFAAAAVFDNSGNVTIAGALAPNGAQNEELGLWNFSPQGALNATAAVSSIGNAAGAAQSGSNLWLAVNGSSAPYHFAGGSSIQGSLVLISSTSADTTPPVTDLVVSGPTLTDDQGDLVAGPGSSFDFDATDDQSGVAATYYGVDADATRLFSDPFSLAIGTHAISFYSVDGAGNAESVNESFITISTSAFPYALAPSTGPIGVPFTISGSGFGSYNGSNTRVRFGAGGPLAPVSVWNDATISGTVPGLAPGAYPVAVEIQDASTTTVIALGDFLALAPKVSTVTPSSAPIGAPFTVAGEHFGPYNGALTRALLGGATVAVSVWNDGTIAGVVPGRVAPGVQPLVIERATSDGGLVDSATVYFTVAAPVPSAIAPSSGPIGVPFTISGSGFGPYNGANTRVRFGAGGPLAPLSVWNDGTISGTIPGLSPGAYAVTVEREDGGVVDSASAGTFTAAAPRIFTLAPSSGPIGAPFALAGTGFGPYNGSATVLLIGGTTAAVSVWNDGAIDGAVPGSLMPGVYPLVARRTTADGGLVDSSSATFTVLAPFSAAMTPSTGPIGVPFTITGAGFGPYNGGSTRVRFGAGGPLAPVSVWNDATIKGTIPGLDAGAYTVAIEIQSGSAVSVSTIAVFGVMDPQIASLTPSSGPIGVPFTIAGAGFGPYNGGNTRIRFGAGGPLAPVSVWNDATVKGTVPGVAVGTYTVLVEIQAGSTVSATSAGVFAALAPQVYSVTPSSGPIGAPFTVAGTAFGPYNGSATVLLIGGATVAVSVWNDGTIKGTVPGALAPGAYSLVAQRATSDGGLVASPASTFLVVAPAIAAIAPSSATAGAAFTITGAGFGPYNGANTKVLFGATAASVSVWNDETIKGTVPGVDPGDYAVAVTIQSGTGVSSSTAAFTVFAPTYVYNTSDGVVSLNSTAQSETVAPVPPPTSPQAYAIATSTDDEAPNVIGSFYEISPGGNVFSAPATLRFAFDPATADTATLAIYTFDGTTWSTASITNQQVTLVSPTLGYISGTLAHASLYGVFHHPRRAPRVKLLSPAGGGFTTEVKGQVAVTGSVSGRNLLSWTLEYAAGRDASFGFTQISSGALVMKDSALLGTWDATRLSGWQTLRLSARNARGQTSFIQEDVYVGDPSLLVEISTAVKSPSGVAVGPSGLIYVADTGNDRVDVFSSAGTFQASFPGAGGQAFSLTAPQGVATDVFGNVYVADTGARRAVKLSSLGQLLLSYPTRGKPVGVAVDRAGSLYVSDNDDARVVKFNQAGSQTQVFALPSGKPAGVAVDAAGNVYVADMKKKLVAVFGPSGALVNTLGAGLNLARPYGVAVSSSGTSIAVSDMASDRVLGLDGLGRATMAFGGPRSGLSGPRGLALDAAGNLYLAAAPVDQILKLGPPAPGTTPVPFATRLAVLGQSGAFVTAAAGGTIKRQDGAEFDLPPGALPDDEEVAISSPVVRLQQEEDMKNAKLAARGLIAISSGAALTPDGLQLKTPATVVLPYDPAAAAAAGVPELGLKLTCWNADRQDWLWMPSRVNAANRTVAAPSTRLSECKVVGRKDGL